MISSVSYVTLAT